MTTDCDQSVTGLERAFAVSRQRPLHWLTRLWISVERAAERYRQRQALYNLDDRMLRDLGITRADVDRETHKPVWRG